MPNESELQNTTAIKKEKTAAEPITIPIVLRMAEFDHKVCFNIDMKTFDDWNVSFPFNTWLRIFGIEEQLGLPKH